MDNVIIAKAEACPPYLYPVQNANSRRLKVQESIQPRLLRKHNNLGDTQTSRTEKWPSPVLVFWRDKIKGGEGWGTMLEVQWGWWKTVLDQILPTVGPVIRKAVSMRGATRWAFDTLWETETKIQQKAGQHRHGIWYHHISIPMPGAVILDSFSQSPLTRGS